MFATEVRTRPRIENAELERVVTIRQHAPRDGVDRSVSTTGDHCLVPRRLACKPRRFFDVLKYNKFAFGQKLTKERQDASRASAVRRGISKDEEPLHR